jgi:hypothetical protein
MTGGIYIYMCVYLGPAWACGCRRLPVECLGSRRELPVWSPFPPHPTPTHPTPTHIAAAPSEGTGTEEVFHFQGITYRNKNQSANYFRAMTCTLAATILVLHMLSFSKYTANNLDGS